MSEQISSLVSFNCLTRLNYSIFRLYHRKPSHDISCLVRARDVILQVISYCKEKTWNSFNIQHKNYSHQTSGINLHSYIVIFGDIFLLYGFSQLILIHPNNEKMDKLLFKDFIIFIFYVAKTLIYCFLK